MTKTFCDICGREMKSSINVERIKDMQFAISSNGRCWDICDDCRTNLNIWIRERKETNGVHET